MPRHTVTALKAAIAKELRKGLIFEGQIVSTPDQRFEGVCKLNGEITVNPYINVVDTLIHELMHRRFPSWSEAYVRLETARVMRQLSDDDIQRWYRKYKRLAKRTTKPVRLRQAEL